MKRIMVVSILAFFSLMSMRGVAQENTKSEVPKTSEKRPHIWTDLGKGIKVARIQSLAYGKEPEFAILRLEETEFKKFQENPKEWVNDKRHHIFRNDVNEMKPCAPAQTQKDPPSDADYFYVLISHWPGSRASYVTYP